MILFLFEIIIMMKKMRNMLYKYFYVLINILLNDVYIFSVLFKYFNIKNKNIPFFYRIINI